MCNASLAGTGGVVGQAIADRCLESKEMGVNRNQNILAGKGRAVFIIYCSAFVNVMLSSSCGTCRCSASAIARVSSFLRHVCLPEPERWCVPL